MDLETAARKRREKAGGKETVDVSGLVIVRRPEDRRLAADVVRFVDSTPLRTSDEIDAGIEETLAKRTAQATRPRENCSTSRTDATSTALRR